jgi:hypothetical protein
MSETLTLYDPILRVAVEVISTIACFFLLRYMIKPYTVTREGRYIGLPLGFGFLGLSYILSAIAYIQPDFVDSHLKWLQLLARAFSFVFLAVGYYFAKKPSKNSRLIWDITFSALIVCLAALILLIFVAPQIPIPSYRTLNLSVRILSIICLSYIVIHCIRENKKETEKEATWVISGYSLLGISQFLILIWIIYNLEIFFWSSLAFRLVGLTFFMFAIFQTFRIWKKRQKNEY